MKRAVVEKDFEYKGYKCSVILQIMGHRCGYVMLPADSKYCGMEFPEIPIDVHGGLTYSRNYLFGHEGKDFWIGWDYAHCEDGKDYEALFENFKDDEESMKQIMAMREIDFEISGYIYSLDDVIRDCEWVVDQLIEKGQK